MEWKRRKEPINESIVDYLENLINQEKDKGYSVKVCVGTDSQKSGKLKYKFATVILLISSEDLGGIIVGRGGKIMSTTHYHDFYQENAKLLVNERMFYEVGKSIEVAYELGPMLDLYGIKLEVHADINPNPKYESNKALQQAIGYVIGMGYEFKIKPDAPASSSCADSLCH